MSDSRTDTQQSNGSGKHRGKAASAEESCSSASPHGRHRREPEAQSR
ncbi:hypothetical protein [Streptomyces sp. NPDC003327]